MKYLVLLITLLTFKGVTAQNTQDTTIKQDTQSVHSPVISVIPGLKKPHIIRRDSARIKAKRDSALARAANDSAFLRSTLSIINAPSGPNKWESDSFKFTHHPYFTFTDPIHFYVTIKKWQGKEDIFYSLIALLIFFALIKNGFHKYVVDLFRIFFRTSVRQRQIKDQLVQSPLPSLLLNVFFMLIGGMFIAILLQHYGMGSQFNFWLLFLYCSLGLMVIYGIKYLTLKFFGWVFQIKETIETYIFIVFATNKVVGIFLLPFVVVLSFTAGLLRDVSITLSITLIISLFAYRYFLSYVSLNRQLKISLFHFILYFSAFEIAPVLLINKLLFRFLT